MKRTRGEEMLPYDDSHPALCFHREVLINVHWSTIRREFREALESEPALRFAEPRKLWRHSQEALGKWVLSQIARDVSGDVRHFFPTAALFSALPSGASYDEQLIRDISLKCAKASSPSVVDAVRRVIARFGLAQRCVAAAQAVEREVSAAPPAAYCSPRVRIIAADDTQSRTQVQRRLAGAVVEIAVDWPLQITGAMWRGCTPVSIPLAAYKKLEMCYRHFSERDEAERYGHMDAASRFTLRAATLALRYEGCLASGSLQLCADTRLKRHLHAAGYHVMDLCASPINAYMASPRAGAHTKAVSPSASASAPVTATATAAVSSLETEDMPNHFCSAFPDTDSYFGSLGNALTFDPAEAFASPAVNPQGRRLLLTLDVPYDEDLCERIFTKLVGDMQDAELDATPLYAVDYMLVLPLWWRVPMQRRKVLFSKEAVDRTNEEAALDAIITKRSAMLEEGYPVQYDWPERLAKMAGDRWVVFDGVFVGGSYEYFCTATNKWLSDVTATEVIGLAQPNPNNTPLEPSLGNLLEQFYGRR